MSPDAVPALTIAPHPALRTRAFVTTFSGELATIVSPPWLAELLHVDAPARMQRSEELRTAIRDMLRHGGYKPTGRGKPASEYLVRAAEEGSLRSINAAVDVCNAVSLHSGFPISVVDLACTVEPFRIEIAPPGTKYVFNPAGQEIAVNGLVSLFDEQGACGNAVKDSQRTKTSDATNETLSVVWGCTGFERELADAARWYQELLRDLGATTRDV